MRWCIMPTGVVFALLALTATGCATGQKDRMAMLEQANRNLTDRLNRASRQLDQAQQERQQLNQRLAAALDEVNALRAELAELPEEQPAAGWTAVPGGAMIAIEGSILFQPGQATLRPEARRTLDAIVSTVRGQYANKDVLILGHTDDQPIRKSGWADNYELSAERALAVVRYLREQGVEPSRLIACGAGEHRPIVPNASNQNRARNRRVEIYAMDPEFGFGGTG